MATEANHALVSNGAAAINAPTPTNAFVALATSTHGSTATRSSTAFSVKSTAKPSSCPDASFDAPDAATPLAASSNSTAYGATPTASKATSTPLSHLTITCTAPAMPPAVTGVSVPPVSATIPPSAAAIGATDDATAIVTTQRPTTRITTFAIASTNTAFTERPAADSAATANPPTALAFSPTVLSSTRGLNLCRPSKICFKRDIRTRQKAATRAQCHIPGAH
mmetsp:Transcript_815/g.2236  ORF Transcript_815/g.2236 Transcript_815/m.2236 type:complete len:223 (+) Transcript_815:1631-2299(+)